MKRRDIIDLVLLGALWGASFLFQRIAVPAFGALPLAAVRIAVAALILLPLLVWRGGLADLRQRPGSFLMLGALNTAVPFVLFAWALLTITAGVAAILNATAPMFAALVAWAWMRERPGALQALGLLIGFGGVLWLVSARAGLDVEGIRWPIVAGLAACLCYGIAGNYARRSFASVSPLAMATGSQITATLLLLPFAIWTWPASMPGTRDWAAALVLGVFCTGLAYLLFFRLLTHVGAARAMTVTFLIPAFAMIWGRLFLHEPITLSMLLGCAVVLLGTAIATGLVRGPAKHTRARRDCPGVGNRDDTA